MLHLQHWIEFYFAKRVRGIVVDGPKNPCADTKWQHAMDVAKEFAWVLLVHKVQLDIAFKSWKVVVIHNIIQIHNNVMWD